VLVFLAPNTRSREIRCRLPQPASSMTGLRLLVRKSWPHGADFILVLKHSSARELYLEPRPYPPYQRTLPSAVGRATRHAQMRNTGHYPFLPAAALLQVQSTQF